MGNYLTDETGQNGPSHDEPRRDRVSHDKTGGLYAAVALARRLMGLRIDKGLTLDEVSAQTGISRSTLSRIERGETSPTALVLGQLCASYGITLSAMLAPIDSAPMQTILRAKEISQWQDPETRYIRRAISPPHPSLGVELIEVSLPAHTRVDHCASAWPDMEQHIYVLEGQLEFGHDGQTHMLEKGDCLRAKLNGPTFLANPTTKPNLYLIAIAHRRPS